MVSLFMAQCRSLRGTTVKGDKGLWQPHPHPFSSNATPLVHKAPFNCSFLLDVYFYSLRSLFAISCIAYSTLQQAAPGTQPNHKPAREENESQAKDSIICINASWVFTFYETVTEGIFVQAKINFWGEIFCSTKGKL